MDREGFRSRLKQYKEARELNPLLKYWEWKELPKYEDGTGSVQAWRKRPTEEQLEAFWLGDTQKMADIAEKEGRKITYVDPNSTLDEVVVTAKDLKKEQQRKQEYNNLLDLGITAAGFIPGVGEFADAADVVNQLRQGNYGDATISAVAASLPFVPASALRKLAKQFGKTIKNVLYNTGRFFQPATYDKLFELYKNTPQLNSQGSFEDYLNYTKTIFPESKINDVYYHGGAKGITKFKDTGKEITTVNAAANNGIYFSPHKKYSQNIQKDRARLLNPDGTYRGVLESIYLNLFPNKLKKRVSNETELYTVLLNSTNPLHTKGTWTWAIDDKTRAKVMTAGHDAIVNIGTNQRYSKMPETVVFDANNIHILGNTSDIDLFKKYLGNAVKDQNHYGKQYNPITLAYEKVLELPEHPSYYSAMSPEQHYRSTLIDGYNRYKEIWGYDQFSHAVDQGFRKNNYPIIKEFTWPDDALVAPTVNAGGKIWFDVGKDSKLTNEIVEKNILNGFDITKIDNVDELGYPSNIAVVHPFVPINERTYTVSQKFKYAEGGQVESTDSIDPIDMYNRIRYQVNGIPINDQPLSGTDPIGEAMMWGVGGGAAAAALRKLFPVYGSMAGWLAFGDRGKDNMLVVSKNPASLNTPIKKDILNKDVQQYFADDVLPRDVITPELDKSGFLNNEKNFQYSLYPQYHFGEHTAGYYDKFKDEIAINNKYIGNKDLVDNIMAHEVNHKYDLQFPLDKEHSRILNRAYTVLDDVTDSAAFAARKQTEKRATNVNVRHKLYTDLRDTLGRKPTKADMDKYIDSIPDQELIDKLGHINSYGYLYRMSIEDRAELLNQPISKYKKTRATLIRKALKRIAMNETDQTDNYV